MTVIDDYVTMQRVIKYASTFIHRPVCVLVIVVDVSLRPNDYIFMRTIVSFTIRLYVLHVKGDSGVTRVDVTQGGN